LDLPRGAWDGKDFNKHFADLEGRYPVSSVEFVRSLEEWRLPLHLVTAVLRWVVSQDMPGSVLVFLPGWHEIKVCAALIKLDTRLRCYDIVRLHSTVTPHEQQRSFEAPSTGRRLVILSTNIAEASLTIPDVTVVVDTGVTREKNFSSLGVVWASKANIIQRRGRAGRVRSGTCVHLFTRARFESLPAMPMPEMRRVRLTSTVLMIYKLGLDLIGGDYAALGPSAGVRKFLAGAPDPPEDMLVCSAFHELQHIGALDSRGFLTHLGVILDRLPLEPHVGSAIFMAGL
jgi:HrpA-like RNA helicase